MSVEFMENLILEQQKTIKALTDTIDANSKKHSQEIQKLNQTIANLQEQIGLLSAKIFGSTSEKSSKSIEGQVSIFDFYNIINEAEAYMDETLMEPDLEETCNSKCHYLQYHRNSKSK